MKYIYTFLLLLGFIANASAELTSKMEYFVVKKDSDNKEVLKSAPRVFPGEVILYKMTFENTEKEVLKDIEVSGLIPKGTIYVENSETKENNDVVMFSIDGGNNWSEKPMKKVMKDGKVEEVPAEVSEYTNIKWKIPSFKGNELREFYYRIIIKN